MISRKPHPTDMSDEEWALVVPYLALLPKAASQRACSLRELFNTLRCMMRNDIS
jgi:hypothetical protein